MHATHAVTTAIPAMHAPRVIHEIHVTHAMCAAPRPVATRGSPASSASSATTAMCHAMCHAMPHAAAATSAARPHTVALPLPAPHAIRMTVAPTCASHALATRSGSPHRRRSLRPTTMGACACPSS